MHSRRRDHVPQQVPSDQSTYFFNAKALFLELSKSLIGIASYVKIWVESGKRPGKCEMEERRKLLRRIEFQENRSPRYSLSAKLERNSLQW